MLNRLALAGGVLGLMVWLGKPTHAVASGNATFNFAVDSNAWYNFETTSDLAKWSVLQTEFFPSNGVFDLVDVESSNYPARFYRRVNAPVPPMSFGYDIGGNGIDAGLLVVTDNAGNIYLVGRFQGVMSIAGTNRIAQGVSDFFFDVFDSNGVYKHFQRLGASGAETPRGVVIGPGGEVVVAGYFTGLSDFRESTSNPTSCNEGDVPYVSNLTGDGTDIFLVRYDTNCVCYWARKFGGPGIDMANGVAVDAQGYIYMTGSFQTNVDFNLSGSPAATLSARSNTNEAFLAKYDALGGYQWVQGFDCGSTAAGAAVCVDASGSIIMAGNFTVATNALFRITTTQTNSTALPSGLANGIGSSSFFLAKFAPGASNAPGSVTWTRYGTFPNGVTSNGFAQANSVAVDAGGNIYVSGVFGTNLILGGNNPAYGDAPGTTNALISPGSTNNCFIAKYSSAGLCLWVKALNDTGAGAQIVTSCVDTNSFLTVSGAFQDILNVDGTMLTNSVPGTNNLFISKFSPTGLHQWSRSYSSTRGIQPMGITANYAGGLIVTGSFQGTGTFGPLTATSTNNSLDVFFMQIDPRGEYAVSP